jgi:hypothetical protein
VSSQCNGVLSSILLTPHSCPGLKNLLAKDPDVKIPGMESVDPALLQQQGAQIWSMLDDMAESDPEVQGVAALAY